MDMIKVVAVPGRMLPVPGRAGAFVGWRQVSTGEGQVFVHDGTAYAAAGPVDVPNEVYYRRALRRGDIVVADEAPAHAKRSKGGE